MLQLYIQIFFITRLLHQRCTRPEASPPARFSTSSADIRLKSPGMVCFKAEAATANSRAYHPSRPSNNKCDQHSIRSKANKKKDFQGQKTDSIHREHRKESIFIEKKK